MTTDPTTPESQGAHHLNTCVHCRDWGHLERHEDHWPPRTEESPHA